jgi:alpha-galactosidase
MGWNSWNRFGAKIDERIVVETAEAMVETGMRDAGYRYVVIDDGWMAPERDRHGDFVPDPDKFPRGIRAVADRVHELGLLFGIYTDAGTMTCQDLPASLGYEFRDARRFAEWGVDYVKVDWCHTQGLGPRAMYAKWAMALHATGRPMVLSICEWGRAKPWLWAGSLGHLWRTCWDIQPEWSSVLAILDRQADLHSFAGPGHWNDPDMLEVGNGALTLEESRAHFALWCVLAAPLMAGNDPRDMTAEVRDTLVAPDLVAIDQDSAGKQGRRVFRSGETEVWARKLGREKTHAVVALNRGAVAAEIVVPLASLGIPRGAKMGVRDLWRGTAEVTIGDPVVRVGPRSAAAFEISPG